jgi:hypothetical protein
MDNKISIDLNSSISVLVYDDGEVYFNEPVQQLEWSDIQKIQEAIIKLGTK